MIVASNLTKFYGNIPAIRDLSFTIEEGEIVGFLGLNGAGKSTTLRVISCQLVPTSGTVTVAGLDVIERSQEIRQRIGYLPEIPPLYHEMTVHAFLDFVARLKGVSGADVKKRVEEVEEITRVSTVAHQVIGTLSAGFRQRVGIAQAVVHKPDLLILDEPFAGLDPVQTVDMREMIRDLGGDHTVLLSSHLLSQIHETCDRILVIQEGRLVAQGREDELVSLLTSGSEVELVLRGSEEDIEAAIRTVGGAGDFQTTRLEDGVYREDDVYRVVVKAPAGQSKWVRARPEGSVTHVDVREALAAAVLEAGVGLRELRLSVAELESVFIQLTRGDAQAAEAKKTEDAPDEVDEVDREEGESS